ncbi:uncharacterized protein PV06_07934 [Exophiala oligosperma]|uniref:Major facilitator superfamily (MFS) profile domain-containing protein n=2 Tax=Exophiala oligosperma TaxID=215243 RepID=A0A0D2BTH0_9EURO|nr:uncharacterized protein PV06_07934 [Exophiala oligosperma]KIW40757.1 hypothetical protein PV06_07934 [Exophiala oligosperma]
MVKIHAFAKHFRHEEADVSAAITDLTEGAPTDSLSNENVSVHQATGSSRIESFYAVFGRSWRFWGFCAAFLTWTFAISLDSDTTYVYLQFATSEYSSQPVIGTISIITSIISGVTSPFWAEMANFTTRPTTLLLSTCIYTLGYLVTAVSSTVSAVCAGQIVYTLGNSGLEYLETLLVADLTTLQWRGFMISVLDLSYIPFAFVAGNITDGLGLQNWRWGFGMFCIIMPVCLAPIIIALYWADRRAIKLGLNSSTAPSREMHAQSAHGTKSSTVSAIWSRLKTADLFGFVLLGFSFALLLAPSSLSYTASHGWKNPSLIAMQTVGGILFIALILWEGWGTRYPLMPKRILNRTFVLCVGIEFLYELGSNLTDTFWSTRLYVIQDYSTRDYTYMNQIETVTVCFFGLIAGIIQRYTHRYKTLQIVSLAIRIVGAGINYYSSGGHYNTATLFWAQFLLNLGGCMSVTCSTVASQGSVHHTDLSIAVALLGLWSSLGGSIGSAISTGIWTHQLPRQLRRYAGDFLSADDIAAIVGDVNTAKSANPHDMVIRSFNAAYRQLCIPQLVIVFIPFALAFFTEDFRLDSRQNAREETSY